MTHHWVSTFHVGPTQTTTMATSSSQIVPLIMIARDSPLQAASMIRDRHIDSGFVPDEEIDLYVDLADLVIHESPEFACGAYVWYLIHFRAARVCNQERAKRSADLVFELVAANRGGHAFDWWSVVLIRNAFPKAYWWNSFLSDFYDYARSAVFVDQIAMNEGRRGHWFAIVALNADDQPELESRATRSFIDWAESKLRIESCSTDIAWHLQYLTESAASAACELTYKCGINVDKDRRRSPLADKADAIFWKYVKLFVNNDCKLFLSTMFYGLSSGSVDVFEKSRAELIAGFEWISSDSFAQAENLLGTLYSMSHTTYSYPGRQEAIQSIYLKWKECLDQFDPDGMARRAKQIAEIQVRPW